MGTRQTPGSEHVSWHRDPLGPHFRTQFVWANRFLQISLSLPEGPTPCAARAIPVDFQHCPCPRKPQRNDSPAVWNEWKRLRKQSRLPQIAAQRLAKRRADLDADPGGKNKRLLVSVDGGFTNITVVRDEKTILGMGEAQVWTETSVALVPAFIAAAYAYLQLAAHAAYGANGQCPLPNPRWQKHKPQQRITTPEMVKLLRGELWGHALGVSDFSDFAAETLLDVKSEKCQTHLKSAVIHAIR